MGFWGCQQRCPIPFSTPPWCSNILFFPIPLCHCCWPACFAQGSDPLLSLAMYRRWALLGISTRSIEMWLHTGSGWIAGSPAVGRGSWVLCWYSFLFCSMTSFHSFVWRGCLLAKASNISKTRLLFFLFLHRQYLKLFPQSFFAAPGFGECLSVKRAHLMNGRRLQL